MSKLIDLSAVSVSAQTVLRGRFLETTKKSFRDLWPARGSSAQLVLALLISADLLFLLLHVVQFFVLRNGQPTTSVFNDPAFSLTQDRGFAEVLQYLKEFWVAVSLVFLAVLHRRVHYFAWAVLFFYLMADDWIQIHEGFGTALMTRFEIPDMAGLRGQDFGELLVSAVAGLVIFPWIIFTFIRAPREVRRIGRCLAIVVAALVTFGVVIDMVHILVSAKSILGFGMIEDWGEMLVMTFGCAYAFRKTFEAFAARQKIKYMTAAS